MTVLYVPSLLEYWVAVLEATKRQINGFFSQLPYECHLKEAASVGDYLSRCALHSPGWGAPPAERVGQGWRQGSLLR